MSSSLVMIICIDVGIANVRHRLGTYVCKPSRSSGRSGWRQISEFINPTKVENKAVAELVQPFTQQLALSPEIPVRNSPLY